MFSFPLKRRLGAANGMLALPVVFGIALTVRLVWWAIAYWVGDYRFTTDDSVQYLQLAENLWVHGVFSQSNAAPFYPDVVRTPGYPMWLAPFVALGASTAFIALLQSVLGAFVPVIVVKTAKCLKLQWLGWTGLLLAIDASLVVFTPLMLTDGIFTLLIAVWLYFMVSTSTARQRWFAAAVVAGLLALIRPSGMIIPIVTAVWAAVEHRRKPLTVGIALLALALPLGWMARNYHQQHVFTLSTIGPNTLYLFNAAAVKAAGEQRKFDVVQREMVNELNQRFDWMNDPDAISDYLAYCKTQSIAIYFQYPKEAVKVTALNLAAFVGKPPRGYFDDALGRSSGYDPVGGFGADRSQTLLQRLFSKTSPVALALSGYQLLLQLIQIVLFGFGFLALWRMERRLAWFLGAVFLYFWLTSAVTQTDARFRLPVLPIMGLCWAAVGQKPEKPTFARQNL